MILLPAGKILHKELSTRFTNIDDFFQTLHEGRFTGYIQFSFWQFDGWILVEMGNILQANLRSEDDELIGMEAYENIISLCEDSDKEGSISTHQINHDVLMCLVAIAGGVTEKKIENLEKINLEKLLTEEIESDFTGFVSFSFGRGKGEACIYYFEGKIIDAAVSSASGKLVSGMSIIPKLEHICSKISFDVAFKRADIQRGIEYSDRLKSSMDLPAILPLAEELFATADTYFISTLKDDSFEDYLKKSLNELAEDYAFLDPFLDEFHYHKGKIEFHGHQPAEKFLLGITSALKKSIIRGKFRNGQKEELFRLIQNRLVDYPEEEKKFSIKTLLSVEE